MIRRKRCAYTITGMGSLGDTVRTGLACEVLRRRMWVVSDVLLGAQATATVGVVLLALQR